MPKFSQYNHFRLLVLTQSDLAKDQRRANDLDASQFISKLQDLAVDGEVAAKIAELATVKRP